MSQLRRRTTRSVALTEAGERFTPTASASDCLVHLFEEGFDVAVRIAHRPDSGLAAIPVGQVRRVIVQFAVERPRREPVLNGRFS